MSSLPGRHPEGDLLLQYLDGELAARKARAIRRHVEACWQCRTELKELEEMMAACVRHRQTQAEALPQPPRPWADLNLEFARVDEVSEPQRLFRRPLFRWGLAAAATATLVAATLTFRSFHVQPAQPAIQPVVQFPPQSSKPPEQQAPPASASARTGGFRPSVTGQAPAPLAVDPGPATLADELHAVTVLHQLRAELGDPVEVGREGGNVVIAGTGISPGRQQEIRNALAGSSHIVVRFSEPQPVRVDSSGPPAQEIAAGKSASSVSSPLEAKLGGRAQLEAFASELLDHTDATMARVYAFRRLAQQFPPSKESQLTASEESVLKNLGREHMAALSQEAALIDGLLSPVIPDLRTKSRTSSAGPSEATWQDSAESLFASARRAQTLLATFVGAAADHDAAAPRSATSGQVTDALARLRADVQQCEQLLTR